MCSFDGATVGVDTRAPPTAEAETVTDGPYGRGKHKLYPDATPHAYAIIPRHGVLRRRDRRFARAAHGRAMRAPAGRDRVAGERARHTHVAAPFVRACVSLAERTDRARHATIPVARRVTVRPRARGRACATSTSCRWCGRATRRARPSGPIRRRHRGTRAAAAAAAVAASTTPRRGSASDTCCFLHAWSVGGVLSTAGSR